LKRVLVGIVISIAAEAAAWVQTAADLTAKYGAPVAGAYNVGAGARLKVTFGVAGRACTLNVQPTKEGGSFSDDLAMKLENELAPVSARHGKPKSMLTSMSSISKMNTRYENVAISRTTSEYRGQRPTTQNLVITWLDKPDCGKPAFQ
jgi:hypothetical protein